MKRAACIVIGSNSTRLVAADLTEPLQNPLRLREETKLFLRMENGRMLEEAIEGVAEAVASLAARSDAPLLGVYATSAVRDAANADALAEAIFRRVSLPLTVLSGKEEAAASFIGAAGGASAGVIDIGGGSTEIAIGSDLRVTEATSLQLGASRLFKTNPIHCAADVAPALKAAGGALDTLSAALARHAGVDHFYSVGGTGTACAMLLLKTKDRSAIEGVQISREQAHSLLGTMAALPRDRRVLLPGFPAGRVDILPTGLAILCAVMDRLALPYVEVTQRCNADGLLLLAAHGLL
ncbi:MAG: hypothetical protein IJS53_04955 [Clostridia bacterium]|nr:hypothetical protein [Clostridia bacterium]